MGLSFKDFNPTVRIWDESKNAADSTGISDFIPGIGDARAAAKQNAANRTAAQTQMNFQERMSNSAYQRATTDMKKAGINPMLAFSQGGASTPSGALPTVNSETKSKLGEFAMSSALGVKNASVAQQQANTQQDSAISSINLNNANSAKTVAETQRAQVETALKKRELKNPKFMENVSRKGSAIVDNLLDRVRSSAKESSNKWKDAVKNAKPLGPGPKNFKSSN